MSVASKNLYDLLGNDVEEETPRPPMKIVEKSVSRTTKRNAEPEAPARLPAGGAGNRRSNASGNEAAFRDRNVGSDRNRGRPTEEGGRGGSSGGYGARARGGRGGRFPRERDDRHPKNIASGSEKQAAQSWGAPEGTAELKDEQAGEAIAQSEKKEAEGEAVTDENAKPEEPEDKHISYAEYLAQQAEKKLALNAALEPRKPNEGADQKWGKVQEVQRNDEEYVPATASKSRREREKKAKQVIEIDQRYVEPERPQRGGARGGRGGPGGPRGGGRGGDRGNFRGGDRGNFRGGDRGDRGDRGNFRGGDRGDRGDRGNFRGRRDNAGPSLNPKDESAFPSLGGK
ncbi:hypothetical protein SODALDRAFT_333153 [Sodiomyces alkalinus F11]|uniref:Hyaluronan/mRNA-binding protein domain-containing protein n=1 Tax=Sodiomyces alkalinus (strain CBS 110278 / VKM F-3762 / F11) TaxID=1314773 RepID=A0A3N2PVL9_SODAK|nr:hypothetical protein SODALDRAFT_333153 [Sodiomyces alkalinus F11]ROT38553.1 hypothetical protein SODALDRAFT_333153 [Sodiomyces alkalinus F11]